MNDNDIILYENKISQRNSNFFNSFICIIVLMTLFNNAYIENNAIKYGVYLIEIAFIALLFFKTSKSGSFAFNNSKWLLIYALLVFNITSSIYEPIYANILKFAGYALCFSYGAYFIKRGWKFTITNTAFYGIILFPLFLVALFDKTERQQLFFVNSNNYVYYGLCCSLLYYTVHHKEKKSMTKSWTICLAYLLTASSVGIIAAIFISFILINRKNFRLLLFTAIGSAVLIMLVLFSNIELFVRIRNMLILISSLSWNDWLNIENVNLYDLQRYTDLTSISRNDNTSFIWRVQHWSVLLRDFFENWYYSFFVGLSDGYSTSKYVLLPHNDILRIIVEYGLIVFILLCTWIIKAMKVYSKSRVIYFIFPVLLYHFTENLIDNFPANCILYFCCGYWLYLINHNTIIQKKQ